MEGLPPIVLAGVLDYLSTEEKHSLRACSGSMKMVVDQLAPWSDWTVVLSNVPRYTDGFWDTLTHRRVTRVAVRRLQRKEWFQLGRSLPSLTTVVFLDGSRICTKFPQLKELGVRNSAWYAAVPGLCLTPWLTHLSVCNVQLPCTVDFINAVSLLVNLQYLLFHHQGDDYSVDAMWPVPRSVFHNLMLSLKKLKHLSLGMRVGMPEPLPDDYLSPPDPEHSGAVRYGGPALTSLELVDYTVTILPENALRSLTSLRSLTVRYRYIREGIMCRLTSWLSPLQQLETLAIIGINDLTVYLTTIPSSVTSLTLRGDIALCDIDDVPQHFPALKHLDINQNNGSICTQIVTLFPHLRTLRIRFHLKAPEEDLLILHRLPQLVRLELLVESSVTMMGEYGQYPWPSPPVQELINQLRELSENRFTIITTMRRRNLLRECDCVWEGDSD